MQWQRFPMDPKSEDFSSLESLQSLFCTLQATCLNFTLWSMDCQKWEKIKGKKIPLSYYRRNSGLFILRAVKGKEEETWHLIKHLVFYITPSSQGTWSFYYVIFTLTGVYLHTVCWSERGNHFYKNHPTAFFSSLQLINQDLWLLSMWIYILSWALTFMGCFEY